MIYANLSLGFYDAGTLGRIEHGMPASDHQYCHLQASEPIYIETPAVPIKTAIAEIGEKKPLTDHLPTSDW